MDSMYMHIPKHISMQKYSFEDHKLEEHQVGPYDRVWRQEKEKRNVISKL